MRDVIFILLKVLCGSRVVCKMYSSSSPLLSSGQIQIPFMCTLEINFPETEGYYWLRSPSQRASVSYQWGKKDLCEYSSQRHRNGALSNYYAIMQNWAVYFLMSNLIWTHICRSTMRRWQCRSRADWNETTLNADSFIHVWPAVLVVFMQACDLENQRTLRKWIPFLCFK